jgi:hypothetical protein
MRNARDSPDGQLRVKDVVLFHIRLAMLGAGGRSTIDAYMTCVLHTLAVGQLAG